MKSKGPVTPEKPAPSFFLRAGITASESSRSRRTARAFWILSPLPVRHSEYSHTEQSNPQGPFPSSPNHPNSRSCQNVTSLVLVGPDRMPGPAIQSSSCMRNHSHLSHIIISEPISATTTALSPKPSDIYPSLPLQKTSYKEHSTKLRARPPSLHSVHYQTPRGTVLTLCTLHLILQIRKAASSKLRLGSLPPRDFPLIDLR